MAFFTQHGNSVERIINAADNAMYCPKDHRRNCFTFATTDALSKAEPDTSDRRN
jgi:hypothetical protein